MKHEIVQATLRPGASVSVVARQYDVNASQVFSWRRRHLSEGRQSALPSQPATPALVPVTISAETEIAGTTAATPAWETIEIEVGGDCRVRVGSSFDSRALERVLDVLRKR